MNAYNMLCYIIVTDNEHILLLPHIPNFLNKMLLVSVKGMGFSNTTVNQSICSHSKPKV